jgi:hypothetical protein
LTLTDGSALPQRRYTHRSAGKKQEFDGATYTIEELTENRWGVSSTRDVGQLAGSSFGQDLSSRWHLQLQER